MYGQLLELKIQFQGLRVIQGEQWENLLLNVASQGCRDSFKKIFNHFYPLLVGQGLKSGLSKEVSAELAQETMIRVWSQSNTFDATKGNASLWIYVIARNLKYDYLRKYRNDPLNASSKDIYSEDDAKLRSESNLEALFDLGKLKDQIHHLNSEQQEIIHKIYFEGLTQQEIAEESGIPLGTVKSRVRLAIATIKELMEGK